MAKLPGGSASLGDLYSKCVQLVNENKISTKNAFDLSLIDHMDDIVDSFMGGSKQAAAAKAKTSGKSSSGRDRKSSADTSGEQEAENRFHEASCTIEASARIYACRVDSVHTDTYRVLGGLNSAEADNEEEQPGEDGKPVKKRRIVGVNTLEKNEANIVQQNIETDEQSDPMFRRMAASFDAGGAKGLLLSILPIAEDLSLVFNGDCSLGKAKKLAQPMFATPQKIHRADAIGLGDPGPAAARISQSKLCPEVDAFRRQLWSDSVKSFAMPEALDALLKTAVASGAAAAAAQAAASSQAAPIMDACPDDDGFGQDMGPPDMEDASFFGGSAPGAPALDASASALAPLPLTDASGSGLALPLAGGLTTKEEVVAFDELFDKFCGGGSTNQFAYFDECWSKQGKDKAHDKDGNALTGALTDGLEAEGGALVAAQGSGPSPKDRGQKRPLFDLSGLEQPARPIETEPVAKHQLSERAAQWQLHKDVPPYMIDRITMPSWQTWSKCDFACLGLRPHLMLKLVRKEEPAGEGPHAFSDLFSTVVVENPEAFPWLAADSKTSRRGAGDDDEPGTHVGMEGFGDDGAGDDDFDGSGLPSHLDVDPQELFLGPGDNVVPGCDGDELGEDGTFMMDGVDFELAEAPQTAESIDIGYSRNSKFVDVKLVKKHLWSCIEQDITGLPEKQSKGKDRQIANDSFQNIVSRTIKKMPKGECENLSVAVCFICALHLCNEKDLELMVDSEKPMGDFAVVAPP